MEQIDWVFTFSVVIVGLVVVFVLLLVLVFLCNLTGYAFQLVDKNKKNKIEPPKSTPEPQIKAPEVVKALAAPVVEKGITGDVVAAISAALACVMGTDAKFEVKSIKRAKTTRNTWNLAGVAENTKPF